MSKFGFGISFTEEQCSEALDGRILLMVSSDGTSEPRFQISIFPDTAQIFGIDVDGLKPGEVAFIDGSVFGWPLNSILDIPPGLYWVQALLHRYETFHRADGYTLKLPMDRGEGTHWNLAPGNLFSNPRQVMIDPRRDERIEIVLDQEIPPFPEPADTKYVKHVRIQSKLLTEFWGRPMHLGAIVLLPEGFDEHPEARYPLMIWHGHFNRELYGAGFRETPPDPDIPPTPIENYKWMRSKRWKYAKDLTGPDVPRDRRFYKEFNSLKQEYAYKVYKEWTAPGFPRMVYMQIQQATPYYDDGYAINSANHGPYGDAINYELIPHVEKKFRCIGEGWARVMYGCSTGGWIVIASQIFYPDMYNGCWTYSPDPMDFRSMCVFNIYEDENAYFTAGKWKRVARPIFQSTAGEVIATLEDWNRLETVVASKGRSGDVWDGAWLATYGPVGEDGYPKPLYEKVTGEIDHSVAEYWRENFDLRYILERDWKKLGPKLRGKIRIYCGDMDNYYLPRSVELMEDFLKKTKDPHYDGHVEYGHRFGHCWYGIHDTPADIDRLTLITRLAPEMAEHITKTAPPAADTTSWRY